VTALIVAPGDTKPVTPLANPPLWSPWLLSCGGLPNSAYSGWEPRQLGGRRRCGKRFRI